MFFTHKHALKHISCPMLGSRLEPLRPNGQRPCLGQACGYWRWAQPATIKLGPGVPTTAIPDRAYYLFNEPQAVWEIDPEKRMAYCGGAGQPAGENVSLGGQQEQPGRPPLIHSNMGRPN